MFLAVSLPPLEIGTMWQVLPDTTSREQNKKTNAAYIDLT